MSVLAHITLSSDNAQVELSDDLPWNQVQYPAWQTGEESALHTETTVAVATRPDREGPVRVEARTFDDPPADLGDAVYLCDIRITSGAARIGTLFTNDGPKFDWPNGVSRVSVFRNPGRSRVVFLITTVDDSGALPRLA